MDDDRLNQVQELLDIAAAVTGDMEDTNKQRTRRVEKLLNRVEKKGVRSSIEEMHADVMSLAHTLEFLHSGLQRLVYSIPTETQSASATPARSESSGARTPVSLGSEMATPPPPVDSHSSMTTPRKLFADGKSLVGVVNEVLRHPVTAAPKIPRTPSGSPPSRRPPPRRRRSPSK